MTLRDSHGRFVGEGVTITDRDNGYAQMRRATASLNGRTIRVGVLEADGAEQHEGTAGATVLDVATWNEFGTKDKDGNVHVPARSFIRAFADQDRDEARAVLKKLAQLVIQGKLGEEQALEQFGAWAVGKIQARIANGVPPPNADSTVQRKGSSTPLVDTGQLRSSITFEVE